VILRAIGEIADESVFVFNAIAEGGVGPGALGVVTLIFESAAVDMVDFVGRIVDGFIERIDASGITVGVEFVVAI
jgi:hypothetical protein